MELGKEEEEIYKNYIIELGEVNGPNIVVILNNHSVFYLLIKIDRVRFFIFWCVFN